MIAENSSNPGAKFDQRAAAIDSLLCVGLDPDRQKIPETFLSEQYPLFAFNQWIIEQTHTYAAAYKPNLAFYEAEGEAGWHSLRLTIEYLHQHHPDIFTIADAKRADIASTNNGYVQSIFDDLQFDAITLHPYLGKEALTPFLERSDKTSIVLCRTSNQQGSEIQDLVIDGKPLWQVIAEKIKTTWNVHQNCMLVVGATYPNELHQLRQLMGEMTFLVPGIGAQGGDVHAAVKAGLNHAGKGMIINSARGIIYHAHPSQAARELRDEINQYRYETN